MNCPEDEAKVAVQGLSLEIDVRARSPGDGAASGELVTGMQGITLHLCYPHIRKGLSKG